MVYRLLIFLYVVVYTCITYILGLLWCVCLSVSCFMYSCHYSCRMWMYMILPYNLVEFFFSQPDDGFIKSLNMLLLWSFNYIYIIKVALDCKVIYILLIIGNMTRMPHLKIVAYVIWFKTVLWTKLCCGWLELQSATKHHSQLSLKFSDVHIFPFLSYYSMLLYVLCLFTVGPCNLVCLMYFGLVCITCIPGLTVPLDMPVPPW